jgi:hypothetical protein
MPAPSGAAQKGEGLPDPLTVDALLDHWIRAGQLLLDELNVPIGTDSRNVLVGTTLQCAVQLSLLSLAANYSVPPAKLRLLRDAVAALNPPTYASTRTVIEGCRAKIQRIMDILA